MSYLFNIIYTPGTARYLSFFVTTLLRWSDCSFRLVTNACSPEEEAYLQDFCRQDARLSFYALPATSMWPHSRALNHLHDMTDEPYFCFMDSDIYTVGEFMAEFTPLLKDHAGLFSGASIWCKPEERILQPGKLSMTGGHHYTAGGLCLGSSYFAIYDNARLRDLRQATKLGFERYYWNEIPRQAQRQIMEIGARTVVYDTGKVLNLLLVASGQRIHFVPSPTLRHLGGFSSVRGDVFEAGSSQNLPPLTGQRLSGNRTEPRAVDSPAKQAAGAMKLWKILWSKIEYRLILWDFLRPNANRRLFFTQFPFVKYRFLSSVYFGELLHALTRGEMLPQPPQSDSPERDEWVTAAALEVITLYRSLQRRKVVELNGETPTG